ncbi:hypothetical protein HPG69_007610 [Diceros bicornis minor]|uniref:Uncharacterized protein n=1 Tax=Diceros bicornis minor TaxID=77932 RepID=A0A7J7EXJ0_DICBM|nr:hypothetical protein HPG69_007610 [Diceros bicornis minor]
MREAEGVFGAGVPRLHRGPARGPGSPALSPQFLSVMQSLPVPEPSGPFSSVPVSVPVLEPSSGLSQKGALQSPASQRHRGSIKGRGSQPPDAPELTHASLPSPPDGHPPRSYDNIWDKAPSPSHQRWPRGAPEAEEGLIQWI